MLLKQKKKEQTKVNKVIVREDKVYKICAGVKFLIAVKINN